MTNDQRAWAAAMHEHAQTVIRGHLTHSARNASGVAVVDQGGLAVDILGPDGVTRRFYVRLTEATT